MILNFIMCLLTFFFFDSIALAKGDLAIRSKKIEFVPIRTGDYEFEIEGLQSKGMEGKFIVR